MAQWQCLICTERFIFVLPRLQRFFHYNYHILFIHSLRVQFFLPMFLYVFLGVAFITALMPFFSYFWSLSLFLFFSLAHTVSLSILLYHSICFSCFEQITLNILIEYVPICNLIALKRCHCYFHMEFLHTHIFGEPTSKHNSSHKTRIYSI